MGAGFGRVGNEDEIYGLGLSGEATPERPVVPEVPARGKSAEFPVAIGATLF